MQLGTVIVGAGQAGFQTAASLRAEGYAEPIVLLGDEPHIPYQRPPLSKGFPLGTQDLDSIELRPGGFYQDHRIDLRLGERVVAIDRAERRVRLASGSEIPYKTLVLAVGARNRVLASKGSNLDGVLYLRTLNEAQIIKDRLKEAQDIVVIGGGFIGLELASVARSLGKQVTVLEVLPRIMSRVVAPAVSEFFRELHAGRGVKIVCGAGVSEIAVPGGKLREVQTNDGMVYPADLALVGIGIVPNTELAREAGLRVTNGIAVDEYLQTEDEQIYAIGDCVEHPCSFARASVRLESVQNAADQAQCVAATIAGKRAAYNALPWFWSDQFDIKLQMAGISLGYDCTVTRGTPESGKFSVFYFQGGRLLAVDSINRPLDHILGRKLVEAGVSLTPDQAADESVDLRKLGAALRQPR
jgi:3-phenylpropionate/trans-cinnamate dioxygenase ferredoxin reductase subunit